MDKDLDIILKKINDKIFNINDMNGDLIIDIAPEEFMVSNEPITDPLSDSQDINSYIASISAPTISINSDLFSLKNKSKETT